MSFEYIVHASRDRDGRLPLPGDVPLTNRFTNPAYALHYAQVLALAHPGGYVCVQIEVSTI